MRKKTKKILVPCIVIAVIIVAVVVIAGISNGWFLTEQQHKGSIILPDYSVIKLDKAKTELTDEEIQDVLDSILSAKKLNTTEVKEGTVEEGDTVTIDFQGTLDESGEAISGGTADGYILELGSGMMVDGFEDGIVGHDIGDDFDLHVTFPEEYGAEELQGQDATFHVTLLNKLEFDDAELTDEDIRVYSEQFLPETIETIDEFKDYLRNARYENSVKNQIYDYLYYNSTVTEYGYDALKMGKAVSLENLREYANENRTTVNELAKEFGYSSLGAFLDEDGRIYAKQAMLIDAMMDELGLECTGEYVTQQLEDYLKSNGNSGYSAKLAEVEMTDNSLWYFIETHCKKNLVTDALKDAVVLE